MTQENTSGDKLAEAEKIVRSHMLVSVASGVLPIPLLDIGILGGVQLRMVRKLADHYKIEFSEQRANALIGSLAGISFAMAAGSFAKNILGVGRLLLGISGLALPAASTYAIGQVFIKHFESGGTIWTFDPSRAKQDYDEEVKAGQQVVEQNYAGVRP